MSEEVTTTETTEVTQEVTPEETAKNQDDARITKANAEAKKYRTELRAAQAELEKVRNANLTESEKAIAEAKAAARNETLAEFGHKLVRAEFRAQAAGRIADLDDLLDDLNLSKFMTEDGEPDAKAIEKRINALAPAKTEEPTRKPGPRPDLSQGSSKTNNMALNDDALTDALRAAVGG